MADKEQVFDMLMHLREQLSIVEIDERESEDYRRAIHDVRMLINESIKNYLP